MIAESIWRLFKVKRGWTPGQSPYECPDCEEEEGSMQPAAYDTGDGWWLHWYCDVCGVPDADTADISWPMRKDWATGDDLKRLGFEIVG